jgi:hypothetical protein
MPAAGVCDAEHRQPARKLIELVRPAACRTGDAAAGLPPANNRSTAEPASQEPLPWTT